MSSQLRMKEPSYTLSSGDDEADELLAEGCMLASSACFDNLRNMLAAHHPGSGTSDVQLHAADANDITESETTADNDSQPLLSDLSSAELSAATTDHDHETQEDNLDSMPSYNS